MQERILYGGIDVDDKKFHACLIEKETGEMFEFNTRPNAESLSKRLDVLKEKGYSIGICYEAGYLGFSLHRQMKERGYDCKVIAPSLIPEVRGQQVKTDRLDCIKLAKYSMSGLLTTVNIPDPREEILRDIIRTRKFLVEQATGIKLHIVSMCRRMGLDYRQSTKNDQASHWTLSHREWLSAEIKKMGDEFSKFNLNALINTLNQMEEQIGIYEERIKHEAGLERYVKKVEALRCYRGFEVLTAMGVITEIGNISRFTHPRFMVSYAGLDVKEYSSGGKEKKFGITKMGNRHLRTYLVEACQTAYRSPNPSGNIQKRRKNVEPRFKSIADRCMKRLYKKATKLLYRGKAMNKVKVACAREMLGFIWESLREAA